MKTTIPIYIEIEVSSIIVDVPVDFDDEDIPFDFPFRSKDRFRVEINIDTGLIRNWPKGRTASFSMKVCDGGIYTLVIPSDDYDDFVLRNCYVPFWLAFGDSDYLNWDIESDGHIKHWPKRPDLSCFFRHDSND